MYDDKFYDLDDGFIDDDEIVEDDGFGEELGGGVSNFYSNFQGSIESSSMQRLSAVANGRKVGPHGELLPTQTDDAMAEAGEQLYLKREKKEQERIQKRFKILTADDIEIAGLLGNEKVARDGDSWGNEQAAAQQTLADSSKQAAIAAEPDKALHKSNRKRDREEVLGAGKVEDATIEGLLNNIKNRVLMGETLNNFKKDIN